MKPTIEEITKAAAKFAEDYEVIGIRTQDQPFELGEIDHVSLVWDDGSETDEELDGICATSVKSKRIDMHSCESTSFSGYYPGEHIALIGGYTYEMGGDEGEIIISDPEVIYIFA